MNAPTQITFRNMEPSAGVTARIRQDAAKLETFYSRITRCRVVVEAPHHHHRWGNWFRVRVQLDVPATTLVVDHQSPRFPGLVLVDGAKRTKHLETHLAKRDLYLALRDAFRAARRQLQDYVRCMRGDTKTHAGKPASIRVSVKPRHGQH